ncbi:uncharacterized protein LOC126981695 [Eriocheir sinensis]|uniref:uncharacterized protein LOC126981695 n=1 Tax=Eriocheir sinensis TaxID=95602 RepID=UPI0021CAA2C6|nr:uncharacterized protein LOC126981695 [Eriocheir sinensis]XP_050689073.1 uncharacterized protein LOC126981695 [Eriocheir sinensis]XP_050689074.1 uncharacterized protein LOC126981695 [Eriocheir sinensis]XP_050689075.1 uncharacterized protein LOC126981695 [Eriocheir sinensis]XP_050689076.1 uncharacterized protein LOC126981695 [Eriocheir sinensis]XP_050689077.1 uncharacterized protein LOC126981695 [Eriocheir sinensis]
MASARAGGDDPEDCPVCLTGFDGFVQWPHTLPCGHTVCTLCINKLKHQGRVTCPECRVSHAVPEGRQKRDDKAAAASLPPSARKRKWAAGAAGKKEVAHLSKKMCSFLQEQENIVVAAITACQEVQSQLDQYQATLTGWGEQQQQLEDSLQGLVDQSRSARELVQQEMTRVAAKKEEAKKREQELLAVQEMLRTPTTEQEACLAVSKVLHCTNEAKQVVEECQQCFPDASTLTTARKVREASKAALEAFQAVPRTVTTEDLRPQSDPEEPISQSDPEDPSSQSDPNLTIMEKVNFILEPSLKEPLQAEDLCSLTQHVRSLLQAGRVFAVHQVEGQRRHARISLEAGRLFLHALKEQPPAWGAATLQGDDPEDCPVCLTSFDDLVQRPRTLPCGHTVCTLCSDMLKHQGRVTCPECRVSHAVPEGGQFPVNYLFEALIRKMRYVKAAVASLPSSGGKGKGAAGAASKKEVVRLSKKMCSFLQEQENTVVAAITACQEAQSQLDQYQVTLTGWGDRQEQLEDSLQGLGDQSRSARELVQQEMLHVAVKKEEVTKREQEMLRTRATEQEACLAVAEVLHCTSEAEQVVQECQQCFPDASTLTTAVWVREASKAALEAAQAVHATPVTLTTEDLSPQSVPAGPSSQSVPAGPSSQSVPAGPSSQLVSAGPSSQLGPAGPSSQLGPAGPSSQLGPAGPSSQSVPAGPSSQSVTAKPSSQLGPAGPSSQSVPAGHTSQSVTAEPASQSDPKEASFQSDPEEPSSQSDPEEASFQSDAEEASFQSDAEEPSSQSDPEEASFQSDSEEPSSQSDPEESSSQSDSEESESDLTIMEKVNFILELSLKEPFRAEHLCLLTQRPRNMLRAGWVFAVHQVEGQRRHARISLKNRRACFHALREQHPPRGAAILQISEVFPPSPPCTVFLDVSWPGQAPRRVHIRLSPPTPRGRQFMLLCTGQCGPSYRGTRLVWCEVMVRPRLLEGCMCGGDYESTDGTGTCQLLPDLDEGEYRESLRAGSLFGMPGNGKFGISIGDNFVSWSLVFGEVVKGLHVVAEAARHSLNQEATVVDCGVLV